MNRFLHDIKWLGDFCRSQSKNGWQWSAKVEPSGIVIRASYTDGVALTSTQRTIPWSFFENYTIDPFRQVALLMVHDIEEQCNLHGIKEAS